MDISMLRNAGVPRDIVECVKEAEAELDAVIRRPRHALAHIVCTGVYNAGKSTLLNALTGTEQFPVGDIPTTKEITRVEHNGAVYIDTPGLNAQTADDDTAASVYTEADLILFVSNAQNGGVTDAEAKWFNILDKNTGGMLGKKLVYVISHRMEMDEDRMAAVRSRFEGDLRDRLGITPLAVFDVDSLEYLDGSARNENALMDESRIGELKAFVDKWVADSRQIMENAQRERKEKAKTGVTAALMEAQKYCRDRAGTEEDKIRKTREAVNDAVKELEVSLEKILSNPPSPYISLVLPFKRVSFRTVKDRSRNTVKSKAIEQFRAAYDARERVLDKAIGRCAYDLDHSLAAHLHNGVNSPYGRRCNNVNEAFDSFILSVKKLGFAIQNVGQEISVNADINYTPGEIDRMLREDVVKHGQYYDTDYYFEQHCDIDEDEEYVRGPFGIETLRTVYKIYDYRISDAVSEMEKDMSSAFDDNVRYVQNVMDSIGKGFNEKLHAEVEKRKKPLLDEIGKIVNSMALSDSGRICKETARKIENTISEVQNV